MRCKQLSGRSIGWFAVILSVALWVAFAISTRAIAYSSLTNIDVAILRFTVPAILLIYALPRTWKQIRRSPIISTLMMMIGGGLPFFLLIAEGGERSSAALVGVVNQGLPPMFVAAIAFVWWHKQLPRRSLAGNAVLVTGILLLLVSLPGSPGVTGAIFLVASALFWAMYSIGMEHSELDPVAAVLLVNLPSAIVAIPMAMIIPGVSHLMEAPVNEILGFAAVQGLGGGLISLLAYNIAVKYLGARITVTACAMSPALTAVLAIPIFGETLNVAGGIGISLVVAGIILATTE